MKCTSQLTIRSPKSIMNEMLTENTMQKAQNHAYYYLDKYKYLSFDQNQPGVSKQAVIFKVKSGAWNQ